MPIVIALVVLKGGSVGEGAGEEDHLMIRLGLDVEAGAELAAMQIGGQRAGGGAGSRDELGPAGLGTTTSPVVEAGKLYLKPTSSVS